MGKATVTLHGLPVEVEYTNHPAHRGARERSTGFQFEPDEPAWIEINKVTTNSDIMMFLGDDDLDLLQDALKTDLRAEAEDHAYDEERERRLLGD